MMNKIEQIIRQYGEFLDNEPKAFWHAVENALSKDAVKQTVEILENLGIDTKEGRFAAFDDDIDDHIDMMKKLSPNNTFWSRFNYAMDGNVGLYGFDWADLLDHLKVDRNWEMKPLPKQYAYIYPPDFDLGYFDPNKFEELKDGEDF